MSESDLPIFKVVETQRGFQRIEYPAKLTGLPVRLVQQSSATDDEHMDHPGAAFLWIDEHHHLNRNEVKELAQRMLAWVDTGSLELRPV